MCQLWGNDAKLPHKERHCFYNYFPQNVYLEYLITLLTSLYAPMKASILHTLGVLPQIPFKLTQSIHVALQISCNFD